MKQYAFPPKTNDAQQWYWFEEGFSKEELNTIEREVGKLPYERATTYGGDTSDTRRSEIKWIPQTPEWDWLYAKLMNYAEIANNELWHFDLSTAPEQIQYTEYYGHENGQYDWHQDLGPDNLSVRKISITVQLSESNEYEGGDLCFWLGGSDLNNCEVAPRSAGNVVLFPSYLYHSVKPVTQGVRKSFVLWLGGSHFK